MEASKHNWAANVYHALCLFTAITLTCWCIYEWSMDNDITEIKLRRFQETFDDLYPSITMCTTVVFSKQKYITHLEKNSIVSLQDPNKIAEPGIIKAYRNLINGDERSLRNNGLLLNNTYKALLKGLQEIDYDEVTFGLQDFISKFEITIPTTLQYHDFHFYDVKNGDLVRNDIESLHVNSSQEFKRLNTYISARHTTEKCYTFDIPRKTGMQIREIGMRLNTSVFPSGLSTSQFYFTLTYPKQFMHASVGNRILIPRETNARCYKFEIQVGSMKVFRRRDKTMTPCINDWRHYDEKQLQKILDDVQCNPRHWKIQSSLPYCFTPEQYKRLNEELYEKDGFMPPCRSIEKLAKTTKGANMWKSCLSSARKSYLDLKFYLDQEKFYEEVILLPAYTLQNLIGNAG